MNELPSDKDTKKRQHSPDASSSTVSTSEHGGKNEKSTANNNNNNTTKRRQIATDHQDEDGDLLARLTDILTEIKTTPSTGEISADLLGQLRHLMLRIEDLAADDNNTEARQLKDESDKYLELWFEDLVAQCEADGEIDWDNVGHDQHEQGYGSSDGYGGSGLDGHDQDDESDDEETIALAMALQDEEDAVENNDDDEHSGQADHQGTATNNADGFNTVELDDHPGLDDDDNDADDLTYAVAAQVNG